MRNVGQAGALRTIPGSVISLATLTIDLASRHRPGVTPVKCRHRGEQPATVLQRISLSMPNALRVPPFPTFATSHRTQVDSSRFLRRTSWILHDVSFDLLTLLCNCAADMRKSCAELLASVDHSVKSLT